MAIYEIITLEQSGFGGEFSRRYLFDKDRIIAISKPGKEDAYIASYKELTKVFGLAQFRHNLPKDEELGWYVKKSDVKKIRMSASKFDRLVKEAYPHWPAEHYTSDTERKVA